MQIGAFPDGFFHAVRQVAKGAGHAFAGDGQNRADALAGHDDIDVLGLETAENRPFAATPQCRVIMQDGRLAGAAFHSKRWTRHNIIGIETAFHDETAGHIPMQRLDVAGALRLASELAEDGQRLCLVDPPANGGVRRLIRHNASSVARS